MSRTFINSFYKIYLLYAVVYLVYSYFAINIDFIYYPEVLALSISDQITTHEFLDSQFHFFTSILLIGVIMALFEYNLIHFVFELILLVCCVIMTYLVITGFGII